VKKLRPGNVLLPTFMIERKANASAKVTAEHPIERHRTIGGLLDWILKSKPIERRA
jgi:hypothetical protein